MNSNTSDVIVVGGGMIGTAFALACAGQGLGVTVVEARTPWRTWPAGEVDLRVCALSRASERILRRLGAWVWIIELGVSPYRQMRVWDVGSGGSIHFDAADLGEPDLDHIVENRVLQLQHAQRYVEPGLALIGDAALPMPYTHWQNRASTWGSGRRATGRRPGPGPATAP